jgi:1-acyl-sn-glycerol-3-phosphate acyltransferase
VSTAEGAGAQRRPATDQVVVPPTTVPGPRSPRRLILRPILRSWLRVRAVGAEHVPTEGPVLLASTHRSHADSIALALSVRRPVHFLGDLELTEARVVGPQLPKLGMVPLRRGTADSAALDVVRALLGDGHCVVVYPEGSRSRDGKVHRLRSGVARVAAELSVPVVPAGIEGIERAWPVDARPRLRGAAVTVRFAPAFPPPDDTPRARRTFSLELQATLAELSRSEATTTFAPVRGGDGEAAP